MDYSVIVPAHNEEHYLPATLEALRVAMQACSWSGELIVVDNDSDDTTGAIAAASGARVVHEDQRQIARARNAGARVASGRMLVFVDADTLVSAEILDRALGALASGRYAVGGSTIQFHGADANAYPHRLAGLWNRFALRFSLAAGCFLFSLAEGHRAIGGFDEAYYASEEIGYVRRLKRWGKQRSLGAFILQDAQLSTSDRKLRMYRPWELLGLSLLSALPFAMRTRRMCSMWYGGRSKI